VAYIDTNILISYYFDEDENHEYSVKIVEKLRSKHKQMYVSLLTIVELFSVISRKIQQLKLPPHIMQLDEKARIHIIVKQILELLNPAVISDEPELSSINGFRGFHVFAKAVNLAYQLKLRTLDLLHIAYALDLASKGLVDSIVSLDKEIQEKEPMLQKLGLKVYR